MNLLFIIPNLKRAGAERMVVNICNGLIKDERNRIAIFLLQNENYFTSELDERIIVEGGGISFNLSIYKKNNIQNSSYVEFVKKFDPDVIHSHLYLADLLAHSYHYTKSTYVTHLHNSEIREYTGFDIKRFFNKRMWTNLYEYKWLTKRYKKFNTNFIACSAGAHQLHQDYIKLGKVMTLPNASPLKEISLSNVNLKQFVHLIWVGRLTDVKRPLLAIKTSEILRRNGLNFKLKIVGGGPEMEASKELIQKLDLTENIEMTGVLENINPIYDEADIMIHTSIFEGLPMVFVEACSNGIPIVTSDCMPDNEIIEHDLNGKIISSDSPSDFASAILEIVNTPTLFEKLRQNALETSKRFGMKAYTKKMLEFYKS